MCGPNPLDCGLFATRPMSSGSASVHTCVQFNLKKLSCVHMQVRAGPLLAQVELRTCVCTGLPLMWPDTPLPLPPLGRQAANIGDHC